MTIRKTARVAIAVLAGVAASLAFAPLEWWLILPPALAVLFALVARSESAGDAARYGFAFGIAYFVCGLQWIYGALSGYIGLPPLAAAALMALLCAALACYYAAAAALGRRSPLHLAGCWALAEWLRGALFSGFPWLAIGYAPLPHSWLYGWLPILGIGGANLAVALLAAAGAMLPQRPKAAGALAAAVFAGGAIGMHAEWTEAAGEVRVSLLQGGVRQELKWNPDEVYDALGWYLKTAKEAEGSWIILPETALPMRRKDLPSGYYEALEETAKDRGGAVLAGMFSEEGESMYNAVVGIGDFSHSEYRKRHLTPYGEYLPFASVLRPILLAADIPYNSLAAGERAEPMHLPGGWLVALSVCYEDVFGNEWRAQLPAAHALINVTNDGWFDGSAMLLQHLRMSQARAAEFGRALARATNTGMTALVDHRGQVVELLPPGERAVLEGSLPLRTGATPYVLFGDAPALLVAAGLAIIRRRRGAPPFFLGFRRLSRRRSPKRKEVSNDLANLQDRKPD